MIGDPHKFCIAKVDAAEPRPNMARSAMIAMPSLREYQTHIFLSVVGVRSLDNKERGSIMAKNECDYSCHPSIVSQRLSSADYP